MPKSVAHAAAENADYASSATARRSRGTGVVDHGTAQIDMQALRAYRLGRVQQQLRARDIDAILLVDPVLTRYATGIRNMQPWAMHSAVRSTLVPAEGKAVAFEFGGSEHLAAGLETIAQVRPASFRFATGDDGASAQQRAATTKWAADIAALLPKRRAGRPRLALDRHCDHFCALALIDAGIELVSGQRLMGLAQSVKSAEEVMCISVALAVAETALYRMRAAIEPGVTEIGLWAVLERTNVEFGGEYMDTRLLSSGGRTNPWFQEATDRIVRPGELVAVDTDMIGPFGYDADISRTFLCPPSRPSSEQRSLYRLAWDQLQHNMALIRPGASFRAMSEAAFLLPEDCRSKAYSMMCHGVGMYGQWPTIPARGRFDGSGEDGEVVPGMVLCCESYVGRDAGIEGVKLEQQVLVTENGHQILTTFPFEDELLGREV